MPTKTLYFLASTGQSPNYFGNMQDGGSTPANSRAAFGYSPSNNPLTNAYYRSYLGATGASLNSAASSWIDSASGPVKGTGTTNSNAGDSWISPTPYSGTFAAGSWTFSMGFQCTTAGASGRPRMRVWASANADGSSARVAGPGTIVGSIITLAGAGTTYTSTSSWSVGGNPVVLNNEYLFFQCEWQETTVGSASNANALWYQFANCYVVTPNFTPGVPASQAMFMA